MQENLHVHKIPLLGFLFFFGGGGSADFVFMGARIFLMYKLREFHWHQTRGEILTPLRARPQVFHKAPQRTLPY